MRFLNYSFETQLRFDEPVSRHSFVLRCMPKTTPLQTVIESQIIIAPRAAFDEQVDGFGNRLQVGYLAEPHESFNFMSYGLVMVDTDAVQSEPAHPMFLQSSTYTMPSESLVSFVKDRLQTIPHATALHKATVLMHEVFTLFAYEQGVTGIRTTAAEAFELRRGVCQDYAQVLIACCRIAGIPARYCAGLVMGEGATHAWVEVHDGENWRGLDPTHDRVVDDTFIVLSYGRDFEDCSIERGMFVGSTTQEQIVTATVSERRAQ